MPVDVDPADEAALAGIFRCDWSPILFEKNTRRAEFFKSADCLYGDVDNTDPSKSCSIAEFMERFRDVNFIISTSKSHGKKKGEHPAADRFHVVFPLAEPITSAPELTARLRALVTRYPFFDSAVSGAAQLIYANPETVIIVNPGKPIEIAPDQFPVKKSTKKHTFSSADIEPRSEVDYLATPANRIKLLAALRNSAQAGAFDAYEDWIKLGMALKASGYSASDYASLSWDSAIDAALDKFEGFDPSIVTAGTLVYYAKLSTELDMTSADTLRRIEEGEAILAGWKRSEQEDRAKALASRVESAKAGPAPARIMPRHGLIRDIASYILRTSTRPLPALAVAAATAFVGVLAGRKYESPTGLGTNLYLVGLAESGSGKEQARKVIKNIAYHAGLSSYMGGESIASGAGLKSSLEDNASRLFLLDEFGLLLQGLTSKNASSYQRDVISTLMILYSSYGSVMHGTEYADKTTRRRVDIVNPCAVVYGTSTHSEFYAALSGSDGTSGNVARLLVINESVERPKRQSPDLSNIPQSLIEAVKKLESATPGEGNLAGAIMYRVPYRTSEVEKATEDFDDSMTDKMTSPSTRAIYARTYENAVKLALTYAVSVNPKAPVIDEEAWAWGRDFALWCANTLVEQFNGYVADTEHGKTIKRVLRTIKEAGASGITGRLLLQKIQEIRKQERDEILAKLADSGEIFIEDGDRANQKKYIHADFFVKGD